VYDAAALPPEIISVQLYAGPGASSMIAAAEAWRHIAAETETAADEYDATLRALAEVWQGPAVAAMLAAADPYAQWLHATANQANDIAAQARAAGNHQRLWPEQRRNRGDGSDLRADVGGGCLRDESIPGELTRCDCGNRSIPTTASHDETPLRSGYAEHGAAPAEPPATTRSPCVVRGACLDWRRHINEFRHGSNQHGQCPGQRRRVRCNGCDKRNQQATTFDDRGTGRRRGGPDGRGLNGERRR
jgi:hypothetical protein